MPDILRVALEILVVFLAFPLVIFLAFPLVIFLGLFLLCLFAVYVEWIINALERL